MHSRRQENANIGVQEPHALAPTGDAAAVVPGRRQRARVPPLAVLPGPLQLLPTPQWRELHEPRVLPTAVSGRGRLRVGARLALPARRASLLTPHPPSLVTSSTGVLTRTFHLLKDG